MRSPQKQRHKQHGVALITALLVVSLATVLAVSLVKHLYYDIRRTENILRLDQAQLFNKNSVEFGMVLISRDWELNNKFDSMIDIQTFNDYAIAIALEGPPVSLQLIDLQSCFNLNNLSKNNKNFAKARNQYLTLLGSLNVDVNLLSTLTDSLIDWIDSDSITEPQGAEFDYYIGLERPYQNANTLMSSRSELRLVKGYTDKVIKQIAAHVCVLPETNTGININTAGSIMLESIKGLKGYGEQIVQDRDGTIATDPANGNINNNIIAGPADDAANNSQSSAEPFEKIADFSKYVTDILKVKKEEFDSSGLQEYSEYFLIESRTKLGTGNVKLYSIIYRDQTDGKTSLIQQTSGAL